MNIDLSKDELALLTDLLQEKWEQLRVEIRRTGTPRYHDELRELERRTVVLLRRIEMAAVVAAAVVLADLGNCLICTDRTVAGALRRRSPGVVG